VKLIVVHYHLRPGGIRRIIETATPHLVKALGGRKVSVVVAVGETSDRRWMKQFSSQFEPGQVTFFEDRSFMYLSETRRAPKTITREMRLAMARLLHDADPQSTLVWAHNLGIARNLILTRELGSACARHHIPLMAHHHDWWFDNRWLRWPEMRKFGIRNLRQAARTVFPTEGKVRHLAINHADANVLHHHFPNRSGWLPNLTERMTRPTRERMETARRWLETQFEDQGAPVWILPCRLLRRKNLAEALLLTRWLRPDAWLVTTGGASSADEQYYFKTLNRVAQRHGWRFRPALLQGGETGKPTVPELLSVCETVMLTSIQEGFGLPYLEAAAARRPLIARQLPNIGPDLAKFGFRFPQYYDEIMVHPGLFNWEKERRRQMELYRKWLDHLPAICRKWAHLPALLEKKRQPGPVAFSRLTLQGQLEVSTRPIDESWAACLPLNPFLADWRERARNVNLKTADWPAHASDWLSGPAYAQRFMRLIGSLPHSGIGPEAGQNAQRDFIMKKLDAEYLYPLLWSRRT
jgi:glycosyltransferase involved in cell wall biosynthesis